MFDSEKVQEFLAAHADEDGEVSDEVMARALAGDFSEEAVKEEKTGDTEQAQPASGETPAPATGDAQPEKKEEQQPVILAKDGVHTIPFAELEKTREELRKSTEQITKLQADLQAQTEIAQKINVAKEQDAGTGDTKAVDELLADLYEDYPSAKTLINQLLHTVETLREKNEQAEAAVSAQQAAVAAQQKFDEEVTALEARYKEVTGTDAFWQWFDRQPSVIRAAKDSGNPQAVADVVAMYIAGQEKSAPAGDTAKKPTPPKVDVKDAIERASKTDPSVRSLSDIPGGSNPATDEIGALAEMSPQAMSERFLAMDAATIRRTLNRML